MGSMELTWGTSAQKQVGHQIFMLVSQSLLAVKSSNRLFILLTGLFAIRSDREYVTQEDFMKAVRKVADSKKLESKLDYKPV